MEDVTIRIALQLHIDFERPRELEGCSAVGLPEGRARLHLDAGQTLTNFVLVERQRVEEVADRPVVLFWVARCSVIPEPIVLLSLKVSIICNGGFVVRLGDHAHTVVELGGHGGRLALAIL